MDSIQQQWLEYLRQHERLLHQGENIPRPDDDADRQQRSIKESYDIILCSPHPDDETLTASLALRLQQKNASILNLAMTLGSDTHLKKHRLAELEQACTVLGFDCLPVTPPLAFSLPATGGDINRRWDEKVTLLKSHFNRLAPRLVICPHEDDGHPTHCSVNRLVMEAALSYSLTVDYPLLIAETEFWHPMRAPNLLLGIRLKEAAAQLTALGCHASQIDRHPYHLRQAARHMDSVRRGAEISGYGSQPPEFLFGELYRISSVRNGARVKAAETFHTINPERGLSIDDLEKLYTLTD